MKVLFLLLPLYLAGCCKCLLDEYNGSFRLVNTAGQDLVFGPNKQYDFNQIKFYSLKGTDTVFHFAAQEYTRECRTVLYLSSSTTIIIKLSL